jgi:CRISPR-associated Cas5-like protein
VSGGVLVRLYGVTAHFRDPRYNTSKISKTGGLPLRTLHCPPPCTVHGLLCAAKGGWVEPESLILGWRLEFASINRDFQTCHLPQRKSYGWTRGTQQVEISPREREFLTFPVLTILGVHGIELEWFRRPANPLSLGRSEDLVLEKRLAYVTWQAERDKAYIKGQCLPTGLGVGTRYPSPLYFEANRRPVGMEAKIDAAIGQEIISPNLARVDATGDVFYLWRFANAVSQERPAA